MEDGSHDLLERGIAAAKAKDFTEARFYLEWALRVCQDAQLHIEVLYWLSEITSDPAEKRNLLDTILANNPSEARARRSLAILEGRLKPDEIINPDKFTQPAPEVKDLSDPKRFICPNCGGRMTFTPDGTALTCEYCKNHESLSLQNTEKAGIPEQDFIVAMATAKGHQQPVKQHTLNCQGCGARFILPAPQLTITCPYCSSVYVVEDKEAVELIPPAALIPFSINEDQAILALKNWFGKLINSPSLKVSHGLGLYLPVWAFNIGGTFSWHCQVPSEEKWSSQITWVEEHNEKSIYHSNILVLASDKLTRECAEGIYHFSLDSLVPFDDRYLANWPAETYKIAVGDASLLARQRVLMIERDLIRNGFLTSVQNLVLNTSAMSIDSFKLILLPVWLSHFKVEEVSYQVLINGQTAQVFGKRPPGKLQNWVDHFLGA
jgi:DNA-directed RNA polymerase subunit RPC12/RpoP